MNEPGNPGGRRRKSIRKLIFGSGQSFGRRETRYGKRRRIALIAFGLLCVIGFVIALSFFGSRREGPSNTAEVLVEDISFDPIKDFAAIRDSGTIDQLKTLLVGLRDRNLTGKVAAVRLDNDRKVIEVADLMLAHPDRNEEQRTLAAKTKISSLWNFYLLNMLNGNDDPAVAEQLIVAADQYLDDQDPLLARDAQLAKCMALVGEAERQKFAGEMDEVEQSVGGLLARFPDDPTVLQSLRVMFTRIRAVNQDYAARLSARITPLLDRSDVELTREFSRFVKDINLLYDAGIGSKTHIESITVDDDDFLRRLEGLNANLDAGVTVISQLDNAIEFLERSQKYSLALGLSQKILQNSSERSDADAAALAKRVGANGITRNQLPQQPWSFDETDIGGREIGSDRFTNQVVAVVFYSAIDPRSRGVLKTLKQLGNSLFGKDFSFIFVEFDADSQNAIPDSETVDRWVTLRATDNGTNRYLRQCPTNRFPYVVLIDRNGKVDAINVALSELKTRVEQLLSKQ